MTHFEVVHHIKFTFLRDFWMLSNRPITLGYEILAALHVQHVGITSS